MRDQWISWSLDGSDERLRLLVEPGDTRRAHLTRLASAAGAGCPGVRSRAARLDSAASHALLLAGMSVMVSPRARGYFIGWIWPRFHLRRRSGLKLYETRFAGTNCMFIIWLLFSATRRCSRRVSGFKAASMSSLIYTQLGWRHRQSFSSMVCYGLPLLGSDGAGLDRMAFSARGKNRCALPRGIKLI